MFENSVVESRRVSHRGRYATLPLSLGLHTAVVGTLLVASIWRVTMPTEAPRQTFALIREASIPRLEPSGPSSGPTPQTAPLLAPKPAVRTLTLPQLIEPTVITDLPETPLPSDSSLSSTADQGDGSPGGTGDSSSTGTSSDPGGGGTSADSDGFGSRVPLPAGLGGVSAPVILIRVQPQYPPLLVRTGQPGRVMLECIIDENGGITSVRMIQSSHPLFEQSAIRAVKQWKFRPGTLRGKPVATIFQFTVTFAVRR